MVQVEKMYVGLFSVIFIMDDYFFLALYRG